MYLTSFSPTHISLHQSTPGVSKRYCKNHAPPGSLNMRSAMCQEKDCSRQATRGELGKKPAFCCAHAERSMVDFVNKKCSRTGCDTFARGSGRQGFCARHEAERPVPGAKRPRETDVRKYRMFMLYKVVHEEYRYQILSAGIPFMLVPKYHRRCFFQSCVVFQLR